MTMPKSLRVLRDRLRSAVNALDTYERLTLAGAWGVEAGDRRPDDALRIIEKAILSAADVIGVKSVERQMYHDLVASLRAENERLTTMNTTLLQEATHVR